MMENERLSTHRTTTKVAREDLKSSSVTGDGVRIWKKQLEPVTTASVNKLLKYLIW